MQIISKRLSNIFELLLESSKPISVSELATLLNVSRRTVFRELENIGTVLDNYNLTLETSLKEGLYLKGNSENLNEFKEKLNQTRKPSSFSKEDRRNTFTLALLDSVDYQKLYYFSSILDVSESTLSLDLDVIVKELTKFNVNLVRKQGLGIAVQGLEKDIRKAMVYFLIKNENLNGESGIVTSKFIFPQDEIIGEIKSILALMSLQLDWITPDTLNILRLNLCVQVSRMLKNQYVKNEEEIATSGVLWQLSKKIADEIQKRFEIKLLNPEVIRISKALMATKAKYKNPISEKDEIAAYNKALSLTFLIIENFDNRIAHTLKNDEEFVRGLSVHLWSAIERIKNGYEIKDPLDGQIKSEFPDIYKRSAKAAKVLELEFDKKVPDGEIACIAAHFGAAVMQIGCEKIHRKLKVSIVCMGGIGVSYMLNSQVKKHFANEITTQICEFKSKDEWENSDFIISTIPLNMESKIVVNVNPILSNKDCEKIKDAIDKTTAMCAKTHHTSINNLSSEIKDASLHLAEIQALLNNFAHIVVSDLRTVEDAAKFVGYRFADSEEQGEHIYSDLMKRETVSTQVMKELDLLLLHCVSQGVKTPVVAVISSDTKGISNSDNDTARTTLVALLPQSASSNVKMAIGRISSALIEDEDFLQTIINGNKETIFAKLEHLMQLHLSQYFGQMFNF